MYITAALQESFFEEKKQIAIAVKMLFLKRKVSARHVDLQSILNNMYISTPLCIMF